jgi:tight adherence protein C
MIIIIFGVLLFATVTAAAYAVYFQLVTEKDPVTLRLRQIRTMHRGTLSVSYGQRPPWALDLIARIGGFLPAREGQNALRTGLVCAGFRRPEAVLVFLGWKVVLAVAFPLLWLGFAYVTARPLGNLLSWSVVLAFVGFYLPSLFVAARKRHRHGEMLASLPDALDLMVVCVEAGLGMAAALQRVAAEIQLASPMLSDELALVHQQIQTGVSRVEALRNLAQRTGVDDVYSLVAMLIQTDRLGTSVAQALRAHAESMRTRRRQRAEQLARKASIKLAFPLVFLVLPALLIIILGPAVIQLMRALAEG